MQHDYLPAANAQLLSWSGNFNRQLQQSHEQMDVSLALAQSYATAHDNYAIAYQLAFNPETRTSPAISRRNELKKELQSLARLIVRIIQASPRVTNQQRIDLYITVRKTGRTPAATPVEPPKITAVEVKGRVVKARLYDGAGRKAKPTSAVVASLFTHVGTHPPAEAKDWIYRGTTGRTTIELPFDPSPVGDTVWITARWQNARGEAGPSTKPIAVNLPAGTCLPESAVIKLAA